MSAWCLTPTYHELFKDSRIGIGEHNREKNRTDG